MCWQESSCWQCVAGVTDLLLLLSRVWCPQLQQLHRTQQTGAAKVVNIYDEMAAESHWEVRLKSFVKNCKSLVNYQLDQLADPQGNQCGRKQLIQLQVRTFTG